MKATGALLRIRSPDHSTVWTKFRQRTMAVNLVVSGAEAEDDGTLDNGSSGIFHQIRERT